MSERNNRQVLVKRLGVATAAVLLATLMVVSVMSTGSALATATAPRAAASPAPVNLGTADNFAVLAKTGISTSGSVAIVGNLGVSPNYAASITGFGLYMDPSNAFATSALVIGNVYAADFAAPTPTALGIAVADMELAFNTANSTVNGTGLADFTDIGGDLGGMILAPGIYNWTLPTQDVIISASNLTLNGTNTITDVWIFQIGGNFDINPAMQVILANGTLAKNVFWVIGGITTLGTTSVMKGIILSKGNIAMYTGATLNGRALSQGEVTLDSNTIIVVPQDPIAPLAPILNTILPNPDIDGKVQLNWNDVVGATSYIVLRSSLPITSGNVLLATVLVSGITASEYEVLDQAEGTWWYAIQAKNASGTSAPSNSDSVLVDIPTPDGSGIPGAEWFWVLPIAMLGAYISFRRIKRAAQ